MNVLESRDSSVAELTPVTSANIKEQAKRASSEQAVKQYLIISSLNYISNLYQNIVFAGKLLHNKNNTKYINLFNTYI